MKKKLITFVKYFKFLYFLYYYIFSFFINVLKVFIKPDEKLILINSFGGKKYDDSPKEIFEAMRKDERFKAFRFVWAFHNPQEYTVDGAKIIKTDCLEYFITALKARCWITNSTIERGLNFRGKNTLYFNTWHGTPIKKMGTDISDTNRSFSSKSSFGADVLTVQGDYEADIFSRVFNISQDKLLKCGLPRNDFLVNCSIQEKNILKKKIGIPDDKIIILYAPTFREYERDSVQNCILVPPMDINKWRRKLGDNFCLLFRAHYEVAKIMEIREDSFIKNMTEYPCLNDLMIVSDLLISDYSSVFFDYSIMNKPMLHFTYDYEKYSENRGMYFDIRNELNGSDNEDDLIDLINNLDFEKELQLLEKFRKKYVNYYGSAVEQSINCIYDNIGG